MTTRNRYRNKAFLKQRLRFHRWKQRNQDLVIDMFEQAAWKCSICGVDLVRLKYDVKEKTGSHPDNMATIDHRVSIRAGGNPIDRENMSIMCLKCNRKKLRKEIKRERLRQGAEIELMSKEHNQN